MAPRINARGDGSGVVGMELPIFNYVTAHFYRAFGFSHIWPRFLSLLGGFFFIFGMDALTRRQTGSAVAGEIAMFLAAFSPLVAFYSHKIQPDVWALALTTWGFIAFIDWLDARRPALWIATGLLIGLAACIKPTYLFIGLPMAWLLAREDRSLFKSRSVWLLVAMILAPVTAWLSYARALNDAFGVEYYYLGGDLLAEMSGLLSRQFYSNTLLTWPMEMALGFPALLMVVWGARKIATDDWKFAGIWLLGAYVVFALAAIHCATPHDYYYLPAVPPLVFLAAVAITKLLQGTGPSRRVALILMAVVPLYGYGRIIQRFDHGDDFEGARLLVRQVVEPGARVLVLDKLPGDLLYRTGLKGWRLPPHATSEDIMRYAARGARYVVTAQETTAPLGEPVAQGAGIRIHALSTQPLASVP
jgi:4-amino-4-deoxy-L-arabinose transferase-like glycosyltransferase